MGVDAGAAGYDRAAGGRSGASPSQRTSRIHGPKRASGIESRDYSPKRAKALMKLWRGLSHTR